MAEPEPINMQNPKFALTMPHSAQPSFSLPSAHPQADSLPGPSSSAPTTSTPSQLTSSEPSVPRVPEHSMHKNRLQEYAQRSNMPLPVYHTVNEGSAHAPRFRSTVCVDGMYYTSENVFSVRKAAEQDVAKLAYEHIVTKIKDEGLPDIFEKTMFFKSILNEFAAKMNMDKVTYHTVKQEGQLFFVSSLVFNGKSYIGDPARSKKEAEQLAARTAILSNLSDSRLGTRLSEVINSKFKFCAAISNVKDSQHTNTVSHMASPGNVCVSTAPVSVNNNNENSNKVEVALPEPSSRGLSLQQEFPMLKQEKCPEGDSKISNLTQQGGLSLQQEFLMSKQEKCPEDSKISNMTQQGGLSLQQEFLMSKQEKCPEDSKISNLTQQAGEPQHIDDSSSSKKRKKNRKKANKKSRTDSLLPVAAFPLNQAPPPPPPSVALPFPFGQPSCSVAQ